MIHYNINIYDEIRIYTVFVCQFISFQWIVCPDDYTVLLLLFVLSLQGNVALEKAKRKKPFGWFPDAGWEDCVRLTEVMPSAFGSLLDDIERGEKEWKSVSRSTKLGVIKHIFAFGGTITIMYAICVCYPQCPHGYKHQWPDFLYAAEQGLNQWEMLHMYICNIFTHWLSTAQS